MTKANPYTDCRVCGNTFLKPVKRAVFCSLRCAVMNGAEDLGPKHCWPWRGHIKKNGYGVLTYNGKFHHAHRASLTVKLGRDVGIGLDTRHGCDNRRCVNPAHLTEGTRSENMRDAADRGRIKTKPPTRLGSAHYRAKWTEADVAAARLSGDGPTVVARRYGVSRTTASKALAGITWTHI